MTALMIEGDEEQRYGTTDRSSSKHKKSDHRHAVTAAVATACVRFGWGQSQFVEAMLDTPAKAGNNARNMVHRKGRQHGVTYLERVWERAQDLVGDTRIIASRPDAHFDLLALRDRIASAHWKGTAGSSAMRVMMAHWHAAYRAGGRKYTLSHREAAEIAGCTARTAYLCATKRLPRWLQCTEVGSGDKGSTWILLDGPSQQRPTSMGAQPEGGTSSVSELRNGELDGAVVGRLMGLDAFAHRGLGSSSLKLVAALHLRDQQSVSELIEAATVSQATAYRHLNRLAEHGLAFCINGIWELTQTTRAALQGVWEGWDQVAAEVGTYGTSWRRQQRHQDERAVWRGMVIPRMRERRASNVIPIRGDEVKPGYVVDGMVVDPMTGEIIDGLVVADDGRFMLLDDDLDYDELTRRARESQMMYLAA
ncbi:ArsR family transcriptional regulator [Streptomyces sp. A0642]|uniref:winged helix-turn-helix domain-containing protein n=1 Tax=Streptomyces sp. A0642 TaxID=2563100 RepID=UPI0010A28B07|nr:helix-turn-helix domain-containing protein [Streptomyces sp. A0642]THA72435.1 ArsR family transcriptional regulator [Streptomyces sp. A0642]